MWTTAPAGSGGHCLSRALPLLSQRALRRRAVAERGGGRTGWASCDASLGLGGLFPSCPVWRAHISASWSRSSPRSGRQVANRRCVSAAAQSGAGPPRPDPTGGWSASTGSWSRWWLCASACPRGTGRTVRRGLLHGLWGDPLDQAPAGGPRCQPAPSRGAPNINSRRRDSNRGHARIGL